MNRKAGLMFIVFLFLSFLVNIISLNFVSASPYVDLRQGSEQVIQWVVDFSEPFLSVLLGGEGGGYTGYLLFEKVVLFAILLSIVYLALVRTPFFRDQKGVVWVVSIAIPLIAVRFLDYAWINAIVIQYKILGIVLSSILPFIVYFLFLHGFDQPTIRKVGWIMFIVIYYGLWSTMEDSTYVQWYLWTIVLSLLLLFFDRSIHRYFLKQKIKEAGATGVWDQINKLEEQKARFYGPYSGVPEHERKKQVAMIQEKIDELYKEFT